MSNDDKQTSDTLDEDMITILGALEGSKRADLAFILENIESRPLSERYLQRLVAALNASGVVISEYIPSAPAGTPYISLSDPEFISILKGGDGSRKLSFSDLEKVYSRGFSRQRQAVLAHAQQRGVLLTKTEGKSVLLHPILEASLHALALPTRVRNSLMYNGNIHSVQTLIGMTPLRVLMIPDIGSGSLARIRYALGEYGLALDGDSTRREKAVADRLDPIPGVPSAFEFGWGEGRLNVSQIDANLPVFQRLSSEKDHRHRLDACRTLAADIVYALEGRKFNARPEYAESLGRYISRLPSSTDDGNILLADAEARTIRSMFHADADGLAVGLASQLKTFLEQHIGLRVYYPAIEEFYSDVKSGRLGSALPLDAVDALADNIRAFTPEVFEASVAPALQEVEATILTAVAGPADALLSHSGDILPPPDPLGELDSKHAADYATAGTINRLWKVFLLGEKMSSAIKGWSAAYEAIKPYVHIVLQWLRSFDGS